LVRSQEHSAKSNQEVVLNDAGTEGTEGAPAQVNCSGCAQSFGPAMAMLELQKQSTPSLFGQRPRMGGAEMQFLQRNSPGRGHPQMSFGASMLHSHAAGPVP
jgi:hypothetical protein